MWCIGNQALLSLCSGVSFTCKASSLKHREGLQQKSNLPLLLSPLFLPLARGTSQTKRPLRSYRSPSHFSKLKVQQNQTVSETLFTPRPRLLIANRAPPSASPNEKAPHTHPPSFHPGPGLPCLAGRHKRSPHCPHAFCNKIPPPPLSWTLSSCSWHVMRLKPSAPCTSSLASAHHHAFFSCNIQNQTTPRLPSTLSPPKQTRHQHTRARAHTRRCAHRDTPALTSGAAEGGVPGQGDQPAQPEQQDRQEGDISEPHLRSPGSMSAPRGGSRAARGWRERGRQAETGRRREPQRRRETERRAELLLFEQQRRD